jgi:hypothetical protein
MKISAAFIAILVVALLVIPATTAETGLNETKEPVIHGVTLEPTSVPTTEIIKPPTTLHVVTEPTTEPVTQATKKPVTTEPTTVPTTEPSGPKVGWMTILSTPSGAEVSIDGNAAGVTPINGRELGAGTHTIRITMAGYEPYSTEKTLSAGEQAAVDATLKLVPVTTVPTTKPTEAPTAVPTTHTPTPCVGCDKGWLKVNCNVDGATASFDDHSFGCTIAQGSCSVEVGTTGTPYRTFTVQKPGYQLFTGTVTSWPANGQTVNLYATLNPTPTPSYGNIQVNSNPSGAIVTIDGGNWQYSPATFTGISTGGHSIQISMSGYQPYGTSAYVTSGQTATVTAYLVPNTPQPQTGSISVVTSPKGADIYVDGNYKAESPYVVTNLAPGPHTLRLHKAGYDEYLSTITVYAGSQTPVSITFTRQQSDVGSIEVASTPAGSSVYLDGNFMGQTPIGSYFDLTSILAGYHTILIRHTDYQDYTQMVYVKGGEVVTVNAQLTPNAPSPIPDTTGQIIIVSTPAGAELFLDNIFKGITPVTLSDIPAGSHVVTVKQAGYADASQTVTVTGGQSTPVAISLAEIPPTTKTPMTALPIIGAIAVIGAILALGRRKE